MIEIGRVCIKIAGREAGLKAVIVDKVDDKFVLVDGEVKRRRCNINHLIPLEFKLEIKGNAKSEEVQNALKSAGLIAEKVVKVKKKELKKPKAERPVKKHVAKEKAPKEEKPVKKEVKKAPAKKAEKKPAKSTGHGPGTPRQESRAKAVKKAKK